VVEPFPRGGVREAAVAADREPQLLGHLDGSGQVHDDALDDRLPGGGDDQLELAVLAATGPSAARRERRS
jgi:hypothetical protein